MRRNRFASFVAGLRTRRLGWESLQMHVRVGLEPHHLVEPGGLGQIKPAHLRFQSMACRAQRVAVAAPAR
jgi:hypothetical protein